MTTSRTLRSTVGDLEEDGPKRTRTHVTKVGDRDGEGTSDP